MRAIPTLASSQNTTRAAILLPILFIDNEAINLALGDLVDMMIVGADRTTDRGDVANTGSALMKPAQLRLTDTEGLTRLANVLGRDPT